MAYSWKVKRGVNPGTGYVEAEETISADQFALAINATFGIGTNTACNGTCDVSVAKVVYMLASTATVVETNASNGSVNVFTLAAGVPYLWTASSGAAWYDTAGTAVTTDITSLFITNAASTDLQILILADPTP